MESVPSNFNKLKYKTDYSSIVFTIIISSYILLNFRELNLHISHFNWQKTLFSLFLYACFFYFLFHALTSIFGRVHLKINGYKLCVTRTFWGIKSAKCFNTKEIKHFKIVTKKSKSYIGFLGLRFYDRSYPVIKFIYMGNDMELDYDLCVSDFNRMAENLSKIFTDKS